MIKYPWLRLQLIWCIRMLADSEYQRKVWVELQPPNQIHYDSIYSVINLLFDDTLISESAKDTIGIILKNDKEAQSIHEVVNALKKVMAQLANNVHSKVYIVSKDWPQVISSASNAYKVLSQGENPSGMYEDVLRGWSPSSDW